MKYSDDIHGGLPKDIREKLLRDFFIEIVHDAIERPRAQTIDTRKLGAETREEQEKPEMLDIIEGHLKGDRNIGMQR